MLTTQPHQSETIKSYPTVSVILPTYNRAKYIGQAISSILSQDYTDFEIIVVDDGSTDETQTVVGDLKDSRIRYVYQQNQGRSNARNLALQLALGRYIAFLDSDDLYLQNKLTKQVQFLDANPEVGMVYTSALCIDNEGHPLDDRYTASVSGKIYKSIAFFRPVTITLPTVMVRADVINQAGGFDERMDRFEDTDMWRRISKITIIQAMPENTCALRTHVENSLAKQNSNAIIDALHYYSSKILVEDIDIPLVVRHRGLGGLYYYYGNALLTVPQWTEEGRTLLRLAFRYWPFLYLRHLGCRAAKSLIAKSRYIYFTLIN